MMKPRVNKFLIVFSIIFLFSILLLTLSQMQIVSAQKNYTPSTTYIGSQPSLSIRDNLKYRINQNGERYGSAKYNDIGQLDLVLAQGTNGITGYVKATDLEEPVPKSLEEAADWKSTDRLIKLYAEDGTTIIGEFLIQGNDNLSSPSR